MGVLDWLFGRRRELKGREAEAPTVSASDSTSWADDELIKGSTFCATLSLNTPLRYLEEHGRTYPNPTFEPEPHLGIWVPAVRTFRELGIDVDEPPGGTMASAFGPVPEDGGELLPFLKDFRRIVESEAPIDEQIAQLRSLYDRRPAYNQFRQKCSNDLARNWFCSRLTGLPGVGVKTAEALFDAGLRTPEEVRAAANDRLLAVPGVGKALIAKIRAI